MAHLEAKAVREYEKDGETKKQWINLGMAFPHREGGGYTILLNAIPAPDATGQWKIMLLPPRERDDDRPPPRQQERTYAARRSPPPDVDEDSIPF